MHLIYEQYPALIHLSVNQFGDIPGRYGKVETLDFDVFWTYHWEKQSAAERFSS